VSCIAQVKTQDLGLRVFFPQDLPPGRRRHQITLL